MWPKIAKILLVFAALVGGILAYSLLPELAKEKPAVVEPPGTSAAAPRPEAVPPPAQTAETPPSPATETRLSGALSPETPAPEPPAPGKNSSEAAPLRPLAGASPEEKKSCPAGWSLAPVTRNFTAQDIQKIKPVTAEGDRALLAPEDAGLRPAVQGMIVGGGIHFVVPGGSYINIDGKHIVGVQEFYIDSGGAPGVINIIAPGLATARGGRLTIVNRGGTRADVIYLDGCLEWDGPREVTHDGEKPFLRYTAEDGLGHFAFVDLQAGATARILPPARIKAWAGAQAAP